MKKSEGSCILVSLPEAKNPGQDAILGHLVFGSSELMIIQSIYLLIVILGDPLLQALLNFSTSV